VRSAFTPEGLRAALARGLDGVERPRDLRAEHMFLWANAGVRRGDDVQRALAEPAQGLPRSIRLRSAAVVLAERLMCAAGRPAGGELLAVSRA
jgi:hypothetical protein